jgi:hypothetical protein
MIHHGKEILAEYRDSRAYTPRTGLYGCLAALALLLSAVQF